MAVDVGKNPFGDETDDGLFTIARRQYQGREYVREADGRWFDERRAELVVEDGRPIVKRPPNQPYTRHSLARWDGQDIPVTSWFLDEWIPRGQVVSLYGRPGSRKSTLLLQWMIAACLGKGFGPCPNLAYGPAYGLFCEDSEAEIARRARQILDGYGASFADMRDCHAESLVDAHMTEFVSFRRSGLMDTTPAWDKFIEDINDIQPVFVCLDVAADFFGGYEIRRRESSAFLRLLDKTAQEKHFALVFSAHPSLRGLRDRSLMSGNTGWEGKVRARLTLEDPTDEDEDEDSPLSNQSDKRTLTLAKANYGKAGAAIDLAVHNGFFIPADLDPQNKSPGPADNAAAERTFLDRLKQRIDQGRYVSESKQTAVYAPTILAGNGYPARTLEAAMTRLFDRGTLKIDKQKRGVSRWIIGDP